jgi:hypothetical protein
MNPVARRHGLVTRELPGELLVYDEQSHQAHCLNATAALVFRGADGTRDLAALGALLGSGLEPWRREAGVREALAQLAAAGLVARGADEDALDSLSRRDALRRAGLGAALLLPAVASIVAPTPAEAAATCLTDCSNPEDETRDCEIAGSCTGTCQSGVCSP